MGETLADAAESENLSMPQHSNRENREILSVCRLWMAAAASEPLRGYGWYER